MLLEVALEIPLAIARGLASGELERVGGVVRDVASKQVVAWLREGGQIANNSDLAGGLLNTLLNSATGGMLSTTTNLLNTAVTARSHFLIMQELHSLTNLIGIVSGIGVLNLATTVISTGIILKRMSDLESAIKGLNVVIAKQFAQDHQVKMEAAIHAADNALNMEVPSNRNFQANTAIGKLFEARQHIWLEIDTLKSSSHDAPNNELMQKNIEQAMHLDTLYCRCLLELENLARAKTFLDIKLKDYRETSRCLVHRHLGTHRAAYFHNSVLESDLRRYIAIEHWLRADGNRLMEILLANRRDFWNRDVANDSNIGKPGKGNYLEALTQSELLIENYRRFSGFHAEIEALERLGISHSELAKQQNEALAKAEKTLTEHDDYLLLVDREWLTEQTDSSAA